MSVQNKEAAMIHYMFLMSPYLCLKLFFSLMWIRGQHLYSCYSSRRHCSFIYRTKSPLSQYVSEVLGSFLNIPEKQSYDIPHYIEFNTFCVTPKTSEVLYLVTIQPCTNQRGAALQLISRSTLYRLSYSFRLRNCLTWHNFGIPLKNIKLVYNLGIYSLVSISRYAWSRRSRSEPIFTVITPPRNLRFFLREPWCLNSHRICNRRTKINACTQTIYAYRMRSNTTFIRAPPEMIMLLVPP